ncbi:MAG TPA: DUF4118 domain-containing protein [Anaerolineaceae bacterium]|nr:DUF4118 domain-containing protein [Anaerolineaceae bacterium]NMC17199.1 DUF4118 domain-containing protein [Chloroflexota bacterium]HNS07545.1 DUF4118 domain-containing protein [Anaerolineaceae bacterium]HNW13174.1 DUF4118 domain-containing protein [Anaerolineaceae bacterium]HOE02045.1 DUF4118 domain-containing protein [Anaerolineaceae bacterium]
MKNSRNQPIKRIFQLVGNISMIGFTTFLLKQVESSLQIQLIALLFLLPVLASTVLWGLTSGIIAALVSFLSFNYFFIQPYFTLNVHQTLDLITLIVFLIVAVVVSQLIGQARRAVSLAEKREQESGQLYEVTSSLAGVTDIRETIRLLATRLFDTFHFDQIEISTWDLSSNELIIYQYPETARLETPADLVIHMSTARNDEGTLNLWFDQNKLTVEQTRLLSAFCNQGALAIERVRLFRSENLAKVLEESDRVKTALLNSVSHELRSPLAAIKASVTSLRGGAVPWETSARAELLATIDEETDALNLLVGNLLDMSRIEAGTLKPTKRWNSLIEIIKGVEEKMRRQIGEHRIKYLVENELPLVPTDYVMMGQVFTNLFSNSNKYAPENTPILVKIGVAAGQMLVKVINQSPPVPEEHLEHIFEKFFRISETDKVTGTGLGLPICKGIVEAHEGKIWAENTADGFTFNITLPLTLDGALPRLPKDVIDG